MRDAPRGLPVRRRSNEVLGLILVKDLVLIDEGLRVSDIRMRPLPFLRADTPMYDLLQACGLVWVASVKVSVKCQSVCGHSARRHALLDTPMHDLLRALGPAGPICANVCASPHRE